MSDLRLVTVRVFGMLSIAALIAGGLSTVPTTFAQQYDASLYSGLQWRMIGPFRGGRVNGVTGVPGEPNTFYFGSVGGGVWKSTNSGRTWTPGGPSGMKTVNSRPEAVLFWPPGRGAKVLPVAVFASGSRQLPPWQ